MRARARAADSWVSRTWFGGAGVSPGMVASRPCGTTNTAAEHYRGQRRKLSFELEFSQSLLEAGLQHVGTPARLARVELGAGAAGLFLVAELRGAVVPVGDLLSQPILDRGLGPGDQLQPRRADLLQMVGHDVGYRVFLSRALQIAGNPSAFGTLQNRRDVRVLGCQRAVIEICGVARMARGVCAVNFHVEQALGDNAPVAAAGYAGVLDRVFEVEQHAR